jgi:hypothetical protein
MKKIFLAFLLSGCFLYMPIYMKRLTCGFRIEKMRLKNASQLQLEETSLSCEAKGKIAALLNQPFFYLGKGAQSYVFKSEDGLYVIKLFRFDQHRNPIRAFFRNKIKQRSSRPSPLEKAAHLFSACQLAYTLAPEETELVYLHLNLTQNELPVLSLKGPLGRSYSLPLDAYRFALQKKVDPFDTALLSALSSGQISVYLDSLVALLNQRTSKGIINTDGNLLRNFGYIDQKAVEIDFGNYEYSPDLLLPLNRKEEISRFTSSLRSWLEVHAPAWVAYLDQQMEPI